MTAKCEKLRSEVSQLPSMKVEFDALRQHHSAALELMGERDEEHTRYVNFGGGGRGFNLAVILVYQEVNGKVRDVVISLFVFVVVVVVVVSATHVDTHEIVAIKMEIRESKHPQLLYKAKLYNYLQGLAGVAAIHWSGIDVDDNVLVLDLLAPVSRIFSSILTRIELTFIRLMEVGMLLSGRVRIVVSHVFDKGDGCCTMLGPVNSKVHQLTCVLFRFVVQKPREQVADAEALLDITNTLVTFVKEQSNEGVTARDFVSSLLKGFGRLGGGHDDTDGSRNVVKWKKLRIVISHVFDKGDGCCTMLGPMNSEVK
ncbi:non-structural maintenance of chromosomes element 4 homolog A [Tanacetum coccineum]